MATPGRHRVERRLAAILAADVAGYSRLTGQDEEGTHAGLQGHLPSLVDPKIAEHRGRIVKHIGNGLLAEFSSVVDAVRCAVDVQRVTVLKNLSDHRVRSTAATVGDDQKFVGSGNLVTVIVKVESHYLDRRSAYGRCPSNRWTDLAEATTRSTIVVA